MRLRARTSRAVAPPSAWRIGVGGLVVMLAASALIFLKHIPFTHDYRVNATVTSSLGLRRGSPVRISGVDVGKVVGFADGPGRTRVLKFELAERGLPVHRDATLRIRPRLFLEGGFYVDLSPGSPSAPALGEDGMLPLGQTAASVQFDQALGTLDTSGRDSLKTIINQLDVALRDGGADDLAAAQKPLGSALRDGAIVARAARGTRPDDLSRTVAGAARVTRALASRSGDLGSAIDATDTTAEALAAEQDGLRGTLRELDGVVQDVPGRLERTSRDLGAARDLLELLRPGVRQARRSAPGVTRLLRELELAARPAELPGLLADLRPTLATLPPLLDGLQPVLAQLKPVTDCVRERVTPVLEAKLDDGALSSGQPVWREVTGALPGLAGASGSFDAEGAWVRYNAGLGDQTVSTGSIPGLGQTLAGLTSSPPLGARPTWLGTGNQTAFRPDVPCLSNAAPDLTARTGGGGAMARSASVSGARATPAQLRRLLADPERFALRGGSAR